ncbi:hypothetical protein CBL_01421 [Carabus blaptoides fortunei]
MRARHWCDVYDGPSSRAPCSGERPGDGTTAHPPPSAPHWFKVPSTVSRGERELRHRTLNHTPPYFYCCLIIPYSTALPRCCIVALHSFHRLSFGIPATLGPFVNRRRYPRICRARNVENKIP